MKRLRIILVALVVSALNLTVHAVGSNCPLPQYEYCSYRGGNDPEFQNCQTRNRREDARFHQCLNQERKERQQREEEQRRRAREQSHAKFCREHPDSPDCR